MRALIVIVTVLWASCAARGQYTVSLPAPPADRPITVHTTDLYYAPWDWDDLCDASLWYALRHHADLQAFVMDEPFGGWDGSLASRGDGRTWQGIYNIATGANIPYYTGLRYGLSSPSDDGDGEAALHRSGRDAILQVMADSPDHSVTLHGVGSLRDIAAAYNKDPTLFAQKVRRIYSSGGREGDFRDANWGSDPQAVIGLLNSGLPMYVAFCGEGSQHDGSAFHIDLGDHLDQMDAVNPRMSQVHFWGWYCCMDGGYRMQHGIAFPNRPPLPENIKPPYQFQGNNTMADPQAFFDEPIPADKLADMRTRSRVLWSAACFLDSVGLRVFRNGTDVKLSYNETEAGYERVWLFRPAEFTLDAGTYNFSYTPTSEANAEIHMFHWETATKGEYDDIMEAVYLELTETYLPEPGSLLLLGAAAPLALRRRRKQ